MSSASYSIMRCNRIINTRACDAHACARSRQHCASTNKRIASAVIILTHTRKSESHNAITIMQQLAELILNSVTFPADQIAAEM